MSDGAHEKVFDLVAGDLCLDFVNTVGNSREHTPREYLRTYADFLAWSHQAGLLTDSRRRRLARRAADAPDAAAAALAQAVALREAIYRLLRDRAAGHVAKAADMATFNVALGAALDHRCVAADADGFRWDWVAEDDDLTSPLWPVVHAAAELLTNDERLKQLHQCAGETCGWFFLDQTRNHSRRWCTMKDCGNRAKVRRHRQKQKAGR